MRPQMVWAVGLFGLCAIAPFGSAHPGGADPGSARERVTAVRPARSIAGRGLHLPDGSRRTVARRRRLPAVWNDPRGRNPRSGRVSSRPASHSADAATRTGGRVAVPRPRSVEEPSRQRLQRRARRFFHTFIVSEDLQFFEHGHPTLVADGVFDTRSLPEGRDVSRARRLLPRRCDSPADERYGVRDRRRPFVIRAARPRLLAKDGRERPRVPTTVPAGRSPRHARSCASSSTPTPDSSDTWERGDTCSPSATISST